MMLNLIHLRAFVTVARELHFGRAAQKLNMTQPPLSRQIALLEDHLGARLLDRGGQAVRLTAAGRSFLIEAEDLLLHSSRVEQVLQRDASEQRGNLILSFYSGAVYRLLPLIVARARQRLPGIQLRIEEMTARQTFAALEDGRIDMGLLRPIIIPDTCVGQAVYSEKLVVALPFDHPLARQTKLSLARLQGEPFIMYRDDAPYMNKLLTDLFQRHGFTPDIVQSHSQAHAILSLVSANLGVALLPEDVREANYRNVVLRPLVNDDGLAVEAHAVRLKRNQNPVLTPMLDLLSTLHAAAAPFG